MTIKEIADPEYDIRGRGLNAKAAAKGLSNLPTAYRCRVARDTSRWFARAARVWIVI